MDNLEKRSILEFLRSKYRRTKRKPEKVGILDEVVKLLEVGRRQAKRLMAIREPGRPKNPDRRGRPGKYQDSEFKQALKEVWATTHYMCGRLLKAAIPDWLKPIEEERKSAFSPSIRPRLLQVSAATIDRILQPWKATKGKSLTKSGGFREQIPIQENVWDIQVPGFMEADTVAHCGGSTMGEYVNSLTMTDIATTWTETRAVFGKGSTPIVHAIEDIELYLPFDLLGYDSDNGTEVLNQHTIRYLRDERIERGLPLVAVTRSREYRKNDNAHVEQRNDSVARRWLGYERLDFRQIQPLVDYYYKFIISPLTNHFFPSFKLHDKIRIKSRTRRVYRNPITPYARVMASPFVRQEHKDFLGNIHIQLNPVKLMKEQRKIRKQIDLAMKDLRAGNSESKLLIPPVAPAFLTLPAPKRLNQSLPLYKVA